MVHVLTNSVLAFLGFALRCTCVCCARSTNVGTSGGYPVYNDAGTFYTALSDFTEDAANAQFLPDIIFNDDGTIKVSVQRVPAHTHAVEFRVGIHPLDVRSREGCEMCSL